MRSIRAARGGSECSACGLRFGGVAAFDRHRVGPATLRRCLTGTELLALGLREGTRGWGRPYNGPRGLRDRPKPPADPGSGAEPRQGEVAA